MKTFNVYYKDAYGQYDYTIVKGESAEDALTKLQKKSPSFDIFILHEISHTWMVKKTLKLEKQP